MQRGYTQASGAFALAASKLLVNGGANEVVNIASTKMTKILSAGSVLMTFRHCERSNPGLHVEHWIAWSLSLLAMTVVPYAWLAAALPSAAWAAERRAIGTR